MAILGIDLGGTKLTAAIFGEKGEVLIRESIPLGAKSGSEVGQLITKVIWNMFKNAEVNGSPIRAVGISVPGISFSAKGTVWAPNIKGWENYPLMREIRPFVGDIPVTIDNDRACYILGEIWQGNAKDCRNAIYLSIGTGIGAGILVDGQILRGSKDIAGSIGWMGLNITFNDNYVGCGCFEYHASGDGIGKVARQYIRQQSSYSGIMSSQNVEGISSYEVFSAYKNGDLLAQKVIQECVVYWGMAVANLVSLFNPEKIILGGGVFGPALELLPNIRKEAEKWAQPISMSQVEIVSSGLGSDAGVFGAGCLALKSIDGTNS